MPIYFDDFGGQHRTIEVEWEGLTCTVTYDAARNTAASAIDMQRDSEDGELRLELVLEHLTRILVRWDILQSRNGEGPDENPPMLPITKANLEKLPLPFLTAILTQINDQQNPPRRRSGR